MMKEFTIEDHGLLAYQSQPGARVVCCFVFLRVFLIPY